MQLWTKKLFEINNALRVSFAQLRRADCKKIVFRKEIEDRDGNLNYVLTFETPFRSNMV